MILRSVILSLALIASAATTARAGSELNGDQIAVAMAIDTAMYAADNCPGFRIIEGAIFANAEAAGVTKEQALGPEWKKAMLLGQVNAEDGYAKSPSEFCERVWLMLGPNPSFVKHQLLVR